MQNSHKVKGDFAFIGISSPFPAQAASGKLPHLIATEMNVVKAWVPGGIFSCFHGRYLHISITPLSAWVNQWEPVRMSNARPCAT